MFHRPALVRLSAIFVAILAVAASAAAQSKRERKAQALEESAKPRSVSGGTTLLVARSYEQTYDALLNYLKRQDQTIDQANREIGQIVTAMVIEGGYSQTGTRIQLTLIKETENATTIRVAVTEQKRKTLLQTEPWSDPKINTKSTESLAQELKERLGEAAK